MHPLGYSCEWGKFPAITLTFNLGSVTGSVTNSFTVSLAGASPASSSASETVYIRSNTTTSLNAAPNSVTAGQSVTLTATVTSGATGPVTFYDGVSILGTRVLSGNQAVFTTTLLLSGTHSLHAAYAGDSHYSPSASAALSETIAPVSENAMLPRATYTVGAGPEAIAAADLNLDGSADLITANEGTVSVLLNNGNGSFKPAVNYPAVGSATGVAIADFNRDGKPDLVVGGSSGIVILPGNGDGTFQAPVTLNTAYSGTVQAVDLNGDGSPDIVAFSGSALVVFLGNGDGTFQPPSTIISEPNGAAFFLADINLDGKPDLVTWSSSGVSVLLGKGDGTFQTPLAVAPYYYAVAVGDFNGDGKPDITVTSGFGIYCYAGNGDGTFKAPVHTNSNISSGYSAIAGDFNGDGKLDLALSGYGGGSIYILFGNGDGIFGPAVTFTTSAHDYGTPFTLAAADFNGDGRLDLAVANSQLGNTVDVFLGNSFPGLAVASTHFGRFTAGQIGYYQLTVSNPLFITTSGTVSVTDLLPAGLTATAISGSGWNCVLAIVRE